MSKSFAVVGFRPRGLPFVHRLLGVLPLALAAGAAVAAPAAAPAPAGSSSRAATSAAALYERLEAQEPTRAGDPVFDYDLGIAALDAGHVTRAIFALERVLAAQPDQHRARAELGRALLAAGEPARAREELQRVRGTELPPAVAEAIDRVLGALEPASPERRLELLAYVEVALGHDSNVNGATNAGQFAIPAFGGLIFTMSPESRRRASHFVGVSTGVALTQPLDGAWSAFGQLNGRTVRNHGAREFDPTVVDVTAGIGHSRGRHSGSVALQAHRAWLSSDVYRTAAGPVAQWQVQLDATSQASGFLQWSRQVHSGEPERNVDRAVVGIGHARSLAGAVIGYGSAYAVDEHALDREAPHHGHRGWGLRLGGEASVAGATAFVEWQHEQRRYGGEEPLFGLRRRDVQNDWLAGLRWSPRPGWQLVPQIRWTRANANVVLYDYDRTAFQVVARKEFQ